MKHSSNMRMAVVLSILLTEACGGKLLIEESDAGSAPAPAPIPAPVPAPPDSSSAEPVCAPPVPWTPDFGAIDVSKLGCECRKHEDCPADEMCVEFPAIDYPRCARTKDPCSIVACRGSAACVVTPSVPALPVCYR